MAEINTENMINAVTVIKIKGFSTVPGFMYYVKKKPGTPQPVIIDGIRFWDKTEIESWQPTQSPRGRKPSKGESNG